MGEGKGRQLSGAEKKGEEVTRGIGFLGVMRGCLKQQFLKSPQLGPAGIQMCPL